MMTPSILPHGPISTSLQQRRVDQLVPQVRRMARRLASRLPRNVLIEDLEGAGGLGLATALSRSDRFSDSPRFAAYAVRHIRGAMLNELRCQDPLTRQQRVRARQVEEATRRVSAPGTGAVDAADIAHAAGLSERQYWEVLRTVQHSSAVSLDALEGAFGPIAATGPDSGETDVSPDQQVDDARKWRRICEATQLLPKRQRRVLELSVQQGMKLCEIAKILGVSESRVCQLRADAIQRLRASCGIRTKARTSVIRSDVQ